MKQFEDKSLNLVLLQIVGPALIMLMVSSLVFFLIEVVYRGPHTSRMYWVMGLFTFASVLVARISIEEGRERAQLFGIALAIATLITSLQLVEFSYLAFLSPLVLIGLIAVVIWTSNKLTWDCTVVDSSRDVSSSGLLERLKRSWTDAAEDVGEAETALSKIRHFFVSGAKSNTPGTWVVYFALVAFPIFGFGQWFVRSEAGAWIYILFAVYFAAALGLLLTTSLLGLERYLGSRGVHIPTPIARNWMMVGGTFALAVMLLVSFMPKPTGSKSLQDAIAALTSPLKKTSKLAQGNDGEQEKAGAKNRKVDRDGDQLDENGENGEEPGNKKGDDGKAGKDGDGKDEREGKDDENKSNKKDAAEQESAKQESQKSETQPDDRQDPKPDEKSDQPQEKQQERNRNQQQADNKQQPQRKENKNAEKNERKQQRQKAQRQPPQPQPRQSSQSALQKFLDSISKMLNWLVYLIGAVAAIVLLFLFRKDLASLWSLFFGKQKKEDPVQEPSQSSGQLKTPAVAFAQYKNPFAGGARQKSVAQLVNYSMMALQAWGREFGIERSEDETPHEFSRRLQTTDPKTSKLAIELSDLYNLCAFSGKNSVQADTRTLEVLWQRMQATYQAHRNRPVASSVN